MDDTIYCLIDALGIVHVSDGAGSYEDVAAWHGLNEDTCRKYRFDLASRRLQADRGEPASDHLVRAYIDRTVGSPGKLMAFAEEGHLSKQGLAHLLDVGRRAGYLDVCAAIEKHYTEACTATHDPCLESGCAAEGEICLQPILRAGVDYYKACAAEWRKLFANPGNRINAWKN